MNQEMKSGNVITFTCSDCGAKTVAGAAFCSQCGLPAPPSESSNAGAYTQAETEEHVRCITESVQENLQIVVHESRNPRGPQSIQGMKK